MPASEHIATKTGDQVRVSTSVDPFYRNSEKTGSDRKKKVLYETSLGLQIDKDSSGTEIEGDDTEKEVKKVPDGGYGWFVVLGCFISHILMGGLERNDGVYFLQFTARFGKGAQLTSWPGALVSMIRLSLGPVAGALCNRYSVRATVLVGSVLLALANMLTAYTPNFFFLFFSHAALQGVARGLIYTPAVIVVNMYFDNHRGIALGLGSSGVGVGTFGLIPLTQYLFDTYGFTGTFLITAAICLNAAVAAMLFRPLSLHEKFTSSDRLKKQQEENDALPGSPAIPQSNVHEHLLEKNLETPEEKSQSELPSKAEDQDTPAQSLPYATSLKSSPKKVGWLKSSLQILFPIENKKKKGDAKRKLFAFHLLKDPSFFMMCCSICLFTAAFKAAFTFIPALVTAKGLSKSEAALVLSITGVFDTVGRIAAGFILDHHLLRRFRPMLYNSLIFAISLISFMLPSLSGMVSLSFMCSVYGLLTGGYISQKSVVVVDILGMENISNSFGLLVCFQAVGMGIGPPVAGALRDAFGGFDEAFYCGGAFMIVAGFLMVVSNIFLRIRKSSAQRQSRSEATKHEIPEN